MDKGTKNALLIGGGVLAGYLLFFQKKSGAGGKVYLTLPTGLTEGSTGYEGIVYVTNTTKKGGVNQPYTFHIDIALISGVTTFFNLKGKIGTQMGVTPLGDITANMAAGAGPSAIRFTFDIPNGISGAITGNAVLYQTDDASVLSSAQTTASVAAAVIQPGGTIAW